MQVFFDFMVGMTTYPFAVQAAPRVSYRNLQSSTNFNHFLLSGTSAFFYCLKWKVLLQAFSLIVNCFPVSTGTWRNFKLNLWHYVHQQYLVYIPYRKRHGLCTVTGTLQCVQ